MRFEITKITEVFLPGICSGPTSTSKIQLKKLQFASVRRSWYPLRTWYPLRS